MITLNNTPEDLFGRLEHAQTMLLRTHPELVAVLREFKLRLRFYAFLHSMKRHYSATNEELSIATGISVQQITRLLERIPRNSFFEALSADERKWLTTYLSKGVTIWAT